MQKRVFCALWMAGFASVAGFPLWFPDPIDHFWGLASSAAGGTVTGALLQPIAIGRRSNVLYAALSGTLCAVLALPIAVLGILLQSETMMPVFDLGKLAGMALFLSFMGLLVFWWLILPMGAVAGITLQWAWVQQEKEREVLRPGESTGAIR